MRVSNLRSFSPFLVAFPLALLLFGACSNTRISYSERERPSNQNTNSEGDAEGGNADGDIEITDVFENPEDFQMAPWVHVIDEDLVELIVEVNDDFIIFTYNEDPRLDAIEDNDVLYAFHRDYEFIRHVVSLVIEGDQLTIETDPAEISDVFIPIED